MDNIPASWIDYYDLNLTMNHWYKNQLLYIGLYGLKSVVVQFVVDYTDTYETRETLGCLVHTDATSIKVWVDGKELT